MGSVNVVGPRFGYEWWLIEPPRALDDDERLALRARNCVVEETALTSG